MRNVGVFVCVGFLMVLNSCSSPKKAAINSASPESGKKQVCIDQIIGKVPPLEWFQEDNKRLAGARSEQFPQTFQLYSISDKSLEKFFSTTEKSRVTNIPLPEPLGCQVFELYDAGTISDVLKAKYPDIVSLKGRCMSDRSAEIRMEYSGSKLNAQISWGANNFVVKPVEQGGKVFYMVYDRRNSLGKKQPFEQSQQDVKKYER